MTPFLAPPLASLSTQVVVDAIGLGAIYALMAVGIGLVFGVLRLVNFAYGQLVMAGAYTLAYTSNWPVVWSIVACVLVVVARLAVDSGSRVGTREDARLAHVRLPVPVYRLLR